jgi:hypothetical protein
VLKVCIEVEWLVILHYPTWQHDTFHTLRLDDRITWIETHVCICTPDRIKMAASLYWSTSLSHSFNITTFNFMLVNFMYFKIFNHANKCSQYLDQHVGVVILSSRRLPEEGSPVSKHVRVSYLWWVVFCCTNYFLQRMHCLLKHKIQQFVFKCFT